MSKVILVLGSKSDLSRLEASKALEILRELEVDYEVSVCSAHRNPDELKEYIDEKLDEGVTAIIGIAGMAAHLPGTIKAIAAQSGFPTVVIGVPLIAKDGFAAGLDSLLSTVRMPSGMPVAVVGVDETGIVNAIHLALDVLAGEDRDFNRRYSEWIQRNAREAEFNITTGEAKRKE